MVALSFIKFVKVDRLAGWSFIITDSQVEATIVNLTNVNNTPFIISSIVDSLFSSGVDSKVQVSLLLFVNVRKNSKESKE